MFTVLTKSGMQAYASAKSGGGKLQFSRFEAGLINPEYYFKVPASLDPEYSDSSIVSTDIRMEPELSDKNGNAAGNNAQWTGGGQGHGWAYEQVQQVTESVPVPSEDNPNKTALKITYKPVPSTISGMGNRYADQIAKLFSGFSRLYGDGFQTKFEGVDRAMDYSWFEDDTASIPYKGILLRCFIPPIVDIKEMNSIAIYVVQNGRESLFSLSYYEEQNPKWGIQSIKGGMRYYFILNFACPSFDDKFDISNLFQQQVSLQYADSYFGLAYAYDTDYNQFFIGSHFQAQETPSSVSSELAHAVYNSKEQLYGTEQISFIPAIPEGKTGYISVPFRGGLWEIKNNTLPQGFKWAMDSGGKLIKSRQGFPMAERTS